MLIVTSRPLTVPGDRAFEVVERKGLGHPDTMADLIADQFSFLYSRFCMAAFGQILNHAVDKATLIGASTRVFPGGFEVIQPAAALLIGNVTPALGSKRVPVHDIFREAVHTVVYLCLSDAPGMLHNLNLIVENTYSSAADRSPNFYLPESFEQARLIGSERGSNDTVFCTGFAPLSPLERLTMELEAAVTAPGCRGAGVGTDVKVMATRYCDDVDITMCVPVEPSHAETRADYERILDVVRQDLADRLLRSHFPHPRLTLNSKDAAGGMYLAPFGTSLGKSDCGAVGRGNRHQGVISAFRPVNIEAPSGKNPLHHAGRLYTLAAQRIADRIHNQFNVNAEVTIVARNGDDLARPAFVNADFDGSEEHVREVQALASEAIKGILDLSDSLLSVDPVAARMAEVNSLARDDELVTGVAHREPQEWVRT